MKQPAVYMMTNCPGGVLYVGVTSDLIRRTTQHRSASLESFTSKYGLKRVVWFEMHPTMPSAIAREKQLKAGSRARKVSLIAALNPQWHDLYGEIVG